jgi:hypothetical protein
MIRKTRLALALLCLGAAAPALAGWTLVPKAAPVRLGLLTVTPLTDWNRASAKPGQNATAWTQDGMELNEFDIFAGVPAGQSLYRERNAKRDPMPRFDKTMALLDLSDLFERSFRAGRDVTDFTMKQVAPAKLGGQSAVHLRYSFSVPGDDLAREGEARLAIVDGALYLINYQAPALHYFGAGIPEARAMMDSAMLEHK